ncbi:MAG: hypothetical protein M3Y56_16415, partial [Armatimonadota bacterium]|nr:hypothetical protein [Armatimonadota bacterium]
ASLSPERQAILKILQTADHPLGPGELAQQSGQDPTYLRQMLRRMVNAGDIMSPNYGLYTIHDQISPEIPTGCATSVLRHWNSQM